MRRFAAVAAYPDAVLPRRQTAGSAGYDLSAAESVTIRPGERVLVPTGVKVYLEAGEVLLVVARSSLATRRALVLPNAVGVIDRDYVDNADNEGHIFVPLWNTGSAPQTIDVGERIAQGLIVGFGVTDDDEARLGPRTGGFGSTGARSNPKPPPVR